ncbi:TonB-dependent siderophore receptor [Nodosilinea sp. LEGE 06152]|nr:TonB-dependent siderophore receptor [Nodosilinea sp. LEGE 06152]
MQTKLGFTGLLWILAGTTAWAQPELSPIPEAAVDQPSAVEIVGSTDAASTGAPESVAIDGAISASLGEGKRAPEPLVSYSTEAAALEPVAVAEADTPPAVQLSQEAGGGLRIQVTGETQPEGYRVPEASTLTGTDTPLQDLPASIQVIPQELLRDQGVNSLGEALRNVSGVTSGGTAFGTYDNIILRGFRTSNFGNFRRNGLRFPHLSDPINANIDRIEVYKGPASVLFSDIAPGGVINLITKQPLPVTFAEVGATVGSYGRYGARADVSGPLNDDASLRYRLNISYDDANSFRDFFNYRTFFVSPVLAWDISDRTRWTFEAEYTVDNRISDVGLAIPGVDFDFIQQIPINRLLNEPGDDFRWESLSLTSTLEHEFSDSWRIRNVLNLNSSERIFRQYTNVDGIAADGQTLLRSQSATEQSINLYFGQVDVLGTFATGSVDHQLRFGVDYLYQALPSVNFDGNLLPTLDLFNPVYGNNSTAFTVTSSFNNPERRLGFFVQDLVDLTDNLTLLVGGRYDTALLQFRNRITDVLTRDDTVNAFSPQLGLVYQPLDWLSLYGSYSRSFEINSGSTVAGNPFDPTFGTQYEIGAKADFLDGNLSATLALYRLTRSNVLTSDLLNPGFSIQTGEQRSQGVELTLAGQITPNWGIYGSYAYTDTQVTQDNTFPEGNRLPTVAPHSFSLWSKYAFDGNLTGLSLGGGLFFVGDRWDSLGNNYQLPAYLTADAFAAYEFENGLRTQLNIKNLFNTRYYEGTFGAVYPGTPFTFELGVSYEF